MKIKLEAHAFAIWRYCERHGWDMTHAEVADGTGLSLNDIKDAVQRKPFLKGKLGGQSTSAARYRGRLKANAIGHKRRGNSFDEYALDLVDIFQ